eukprot:3275727-Rhodomonas_salina.2
MQYKRQPTAVQYLKFQLVLRRPTLFLPVCESLPKECERKYEVVKLVPLRNSVIPEGARSVRVPGILYFVTAGAVGHGPNPPAVVHYVVIFRLPPGFKVDCS